MGTGTIRLRDAWLAALALLGLLLVALAVHAKPIHASLSGHDAVVSPRPQNAPPPPLVQDQRGRPPGSHHWLTVLGDVLLIMLQIGVVLALAAAAGWLLRRRFRQFRSRRRAGRRSAYPLDDALATPDLQREVSRAVEDAWRRSQHGDTRNAVIACWIRLEDIAESVGFARRATDTSTELAQRLQAKLALSPGALNRLSELYREARFSSHPMSPASIQQAQQALQRLASELDRARSAGANRG